MDQIVGRSDTTMRNTNDTTSIDIDVLHELLRTGMRLRLHEIDDSLFRLTQLQGIEVTLFT